ncbi:HlyD family secretion protein [Ancylobacter radicis]|uniref:HlyD family efflux transporter periplasmic adaptor subunit n=1 Tax=Ancylobacter radicis TaxID=2836179 RepID=A0ABS5R2F8_9HYPH|nr:HlyD family efflux transporter periplasmic adaptor subunit [Ancylobacter radicis]MBS9475796.1 HlyD family efflux transporter periplasmic adaptor subunit [Ancylobacter radicis]
MPDALTAADTASPAAVDHPRRGRAGRGHDIRCVALLALVLTLGACTDPGPARYQGYAEGELVFVGPDEAGRLLRLAVEEGDQVAVGAPLFTVDPLLQQAEADAAQASLAQTQAELENLRTAAQRPEEIAVLEAGKRRAAAALDLSRIELERQKELFDRKVGSKASLDTAQHTYDQNQAALDEADQQIAVARMASRQTQIAAAERAVDAAVANLAAARTRLERRSLASPVAGSVETVYFRPGELVPAGRPVVSLLPPERIKLRFFVPEPDLPRFQMGTRVRVTCDGCAAPVEARVSYIAASAEYTPPVIYSLDERSKLVFLLEARAQTPGALRPGQPITVDLQP